MDDHSEEPIIETVSFGEPDVTLELLAELLFENPFGSKLGQHSITFGLNHRAENGSNRDHPILTVTKSVPASICSPHIRGIPIDCRIYPDREQRIPAIRDAIVSLKRAEYFEIHELREKGFKL